MDAFAELVGIMFMLPGPRTMLRALLLGIWFG